MKFSTLSIASFAATALATTYYETLVHYVTVDADGNVVGTSVGADTSDVATQSAAATDAGSADETSYAATSTVVVEEASSTSLTSTSVTSTSVTSTAATSTKAASSQAAATPATSTYTSSTAAAAAAASSAVESATSVFAQAAAETSAAASSTTTESTTSTSSSSADTSFASAILNAHNEKRADHSASDLTWDTTVYEYAQAYADKYTCGGDLVHSGGEYGENLASGYSSGVAAFNAWYSEGSGYDYTTADTFSHFTAIIWKSTSKLGCAYKDCGDDGLYVICSYDTAGNVVGEGTENLSSN